MLRRIVENLKSFFQSEAGSIMPLTAGMLPLIIGMTGLGVDVSSWVMTQRNLQTAVDAAVMAAA